MGKISISILFSNLKYSATIIKKKVIDGNTIINFNFEQLLQPLVTFEPVNLKLGSKKVLMRTSIFVQ